MRQIKVFNWLTADGYFAGSDGNRWWTRSSTSPATSCCATSAPP